ncbi:IclR family transcriptional regulator domain-containing protein [Paraburkholderia caffeinilytica]|uniref:IclR family transcriptional regulator domain-containing protein n=1 Tax=Paraburkholderia caffeinilytica TaxID=1761016 RepID=UPI003D9FB5D5
MSVGEGTASLDKALGVLDLIGAAPNGMSNAELLDQAGLPKTTLYRILATLVERGLVRRDQVRRVYRLGFRYLELVRNAYLMPDLVAAASVELRTLRDLTGETSYLAVLDGGTVLSLERCDGAHSQRSAATLGQSKPLHCTGQGKAILSRLPKDQCEALVKSITLDALTPHTITDRRRLQIELGITRSRGYAIDDEEIVLGVRCVAAPIVDTAGEVRGALSVAGPAYRLSLTRLELLGPELADAARRVGSQLTVSRYQSGVEEVEPVSDGWAFHGAFPVWSSMSRCLYWADALAPAVHCFDGKQDRIIARLDAPITAMLLRGDTLIVVHDGHYVRLEADGHVTRISDASVWTDPTINALCVDPQGGCWVALCAEGDTECSLGVVDDEGRVRPHWRFSERIEAMTWAHDGVTAYAVAPDSGTLFMLRKGSPTVRRLASMPKGSGRLSGIALDEDGGLWTALKDGWTLVRFAADGSVDRLVSLPVAAPTGLAFVPDADGPALYVTSDRHLQSLESLTSAPWSGRLLKVRPGAAPARVQA